MYMYTVTYSFIDRFCLYLLELGRKINCLHASFRIAIITNMTFYNLKIRNVRSNRGNYMYIYMY